MAAETPGSLERRAQPTALARWLRLAAAAAVLLLLSEALWLWQTWPVRELLQAPAPATPVAAAGR
jgi:hypothetical protein